MEHHSSVETESQGINNSYSGYNLKDAFNNGLVEFTSFIEGLPDSQREKLLWPCYNKALKYNKALINFFRHFVKKSISIRFVKACNSTK